MSIRHKQTDAILALLEEANGQWVPLPAILQLGIAQYNSRILELRRTGHRIENRVESANGARHSWYRLVVRGQQPIQQNQQLPSLAPIGANESATLGPIDPRVSTMLEYEMGRRRTR
jgi:Helix-turn-helix domain